ncbi:beta-N-acetylhexosaminidase [Erpetoichthys calabaricus]|uniref:beta-N-acetylhexosaminidase n=1 Tax=Erpetoichthys calabaricus TaxID=27687 RepID=UPI002234BCC3|nr:beta-N-acetylhexosaminidase [Erpetoichthys calabaricus]XP_028669658.2 beta-N-acetylhexosaminidase [Erpetoichthys calabaricus]XP_028669659.2 beta-N-acetylhexosaminidase [Erpetoichthys calabaricus]
MTGYRRHVALRLIVLTIVVLALFKVFFKARLVPKPTLPSSFWGNNVKFMAPIAQEGKAASEEKHFKEALPPPEPEKPQRPMVTSPLRLVHLDLKGAALKVSYLEQVFPLLSTLGATGILLEYEDMFPFEGDFAMLRSPHAYSIEDVEKIQQLAELNKLEVIPLIQTFGHLEFVLKHEKYWSFREFQRFPNSLNPHHPESLGLVKAILSQVLDRHRKAKWIHIGADEVFHLGEGIDSKNWLRNNNGNLGQMYLNHVKEVSAFVVEKYPWMGVILWDDMMRRTSIDLIKESGITRFAAPMIWQYGEQLNFEAIDKYITSYANAGFQTVWFASAFKGASDVAQIWTPIGVHLNNHLSWHKVISSMAKYPGIHWQGIALTGWQRYDHFSVLCELLPVSLPSLGVCLQSLIHGAFNDESKKTTLDILGCTNIDLKNNLCEGGGVFPGSEIYRMVLHIRDKLKLETETFLNNKHIRGWFSHYQRKYHFGNPRNLDFFGEKMLKFLEEWENFIQSFRTQMESTYFPDTIEEWMEDNVNIYMDPLRELAKDFKEAIDKNGGVKKALK